MLFKLLRFLAFVRNRVALILLRSKMRQSYRQAAKSWLDSARARVKEGYPEWTSGNNDESLRCMEVNLNEAGATYKDIGTYPEEVRQLRLLGYKAAAKAELKWFHHMGFQYHLDRMEENLMKGGFS